MVADVDLALLVFAAAVSVTVPLPEPLAGLRVTQVAVLAFDAVQVQPVGAVTVTLCVPPLAANERDVGDTAYVHAVDDVVLERNAAIVPVLAFSARALFWLDVPVAAP
jgi:hypothetical protein